MGKSKISKYSGRAPLPRFEDHDFLEIPYFIARLMALSFNHVTKIGQTFLLHIVTQP